MGGTDHFIIFNSNAALVAKNVLSTMPGPRSPWTQANGQRQQFKIAFIILMICVVGEGDFLVFPFHEACLEDEVKEQNCYEPQE